MPFLVVLAAVYLYSQHVKGELKGWGSRKLSNGQQWIADRRSDARASRSDRGNLRLRDAFLARPVLAVADALWGVGRTSRVAAGVAWKGSKPTAREWKAKLAERRAANKAALQARRGPRPLPGEQEVMQNPCRQCHTRDSLADGLCTHCMDHEPWPERDGLPASVSVTPAPDVTHVRRPIHLVKTTQQNTTGRNDHMNEPADYEALKANHTELEDGAKAEFDDATADLKRAEGEHKRRQNYAEQVRARWNAQVAAPYLALAEAQKATVDDKRKALTHAEASVAAVKAARGEVEKAAQLYEAAKKAGFKGAVSGAKAAVGASN